MARVVPSVRRASAQGTTVTLSAPIADGDAVPPGSALLVNNTDASALTVTVVTGGTVGSGLAIADITVTVPATTMELIGPFTEDFLRQPGGGATGGLVHVDYSRVTNVTRAVIGLGI